MNGNQKVTLTNFLWVNFSFLFIIRKDVRLTWDNFEKFFENPEDKVQRNDLFLISQIDNNGVLMRTMK